tara:strand:+ start:414 stop:584 length:171 start_codon:yes stop_codon:yes gene_type:complete
LGERNSGFAVMNGLRIAPVLQGHRGKTCADTVAIPKAINAVQGYVMAEPSGLQEIS